MLNAHQVDHSTKEILLGEISLGKNNASSIHFFRQKIPCFNHNLRFGKNENDILTLFPINSYNISLLLLIRCTIISNITFIDLKISVIGNIDTKYANSPLHAR